MAGQNLEPLKGNLEPAVCQLNSHEILILGGRYRQHNRISISMIYDTWSDRLGAEQPIKFILGGQQDR